MTFIPHNALTLKFNGRARVLQTIVQISLPASSEAEAVEKQIKAKEYTGIWDTGATNSLITKKIVEEMGFKPIGAVEVHHAQGTVIANTYLVNFILPNRVVVPNVTVTEGVLNGSDILIGMDIITLGDFSITNKKEKTAMSFRVPSCADIDYVIESNQYNHVMQNGDQKTKKYYQAKYQT